MQGQTDRQRNRHAMTNTQTRHKKLNMTEQTDGQKYGQMSGQTDRRSDVRTRRENGWKYRHATIERRADR